jgi:4-hydroxy-4-methyl-2-oxoglutarate aldolase
MGARAGPAGSARLKFGMPAGCGHGRHPSPPERPDMQSNEDPTVKLARERLYSAVISDTLDQLQIPNQVMHSELRPLDENLVLCGRARTGDYKDVYHAEPDSDPFELVVNLIDNLKRDDVLVLACGQSGRIHPFGESQAVAAARRGAAGCVTDGLMRDVRPIRALGWPAFAAGFGVVKLHGRGRLVAFDVPVHCGGVWVSPGDLVFGDVDGILVVPRDVEDEVIRVSLERADLERKIVRELADGAGILDVHRKYGTL